MVDPVLFLQMDIFDAADRYRREDKQVIVLAGKEYGSGSSRDWAAKGPWMLVCNLIFIVLLLYVMVCFLFCGEKVEIQRFKMFVHSFGFSNDALLFCHLELHIFVN